ncbi:HD-GYP domain-containing protein [Robertmurraya korlensis]|uniref:HD-GYP domain-containing protein n=1 Tax=Robertmurraya korlensis TaxID=519977 RepID=UPI000824F2A6|nr:HD-GYP domain-containing protein [Robertmurraya korlensis]
METEHLTVQEIDDILENFSNKAKEQIKYGYSNKEAIKMITSKINEASKKVELIFSKLMLGEELSLSNIEKEILPVISQASEIPHIYYLFYDLNKMEEYTYRHTIGVGIISLMIGKWLKLSEEELTELAMGATLHDIGKTRIDPTILNKKGKLTKEEYEEIQLHTSYGYEILRKVDQLSDRVALVALHHHEREDGRGYPKGLVSNQIDLYSKIVAIADMFHAMLSRRSYQEPLPFYTVLRQLQDHAFGMLDANITLLFLYKLMDSIIGRSVMLSDGSVGKIIMVDRYDPLRTLVQVNDRIIDLKLNRELNIEKVVNDE